MKLKPFFPIPNSGLCLKSAQPDSMRSGGLSLDTARTSACATLALLFSVIPNIRHLDQLTHLIQPRSRTHPDPLFQEILTVEICFHSSARLIASLRITQV